jgi:hypothetical protein
MATNRRAAKELNSRSKNGAIVDALYRAIDNIKTAERGRDPRAQALALNAAMEDMRDAARATRGQMRFLVDTHGIEAPTGFYRRETETDAAERSPSRDEPTVERELEQEHEIAADREVLAR